MYILAQTNQIDCHQIEVTPAMGHPEQIVPWELDSRYATKTRIQSAASTYYKSQTLFMFQKTKSNT